MLSVMVFLHVLAVVIAVGGMHYVMTVLMPVAKKMGPPSGPALMEAASNKFRTLVWVSIALLVITGGHLTFARGLLQTDRAPFLLVKIGLALVIFAISLGMTLPLPALAGLQKKRPLLLRINIVLAMVVIFLGIWIKR